MKAINQSLLSLLLLTVFATAVAADDQKSSRSAGKLQGDQSIDLAQELEQREPLIYPNSGVAENYASRPANAANAGVANRHDQLFEIYQSDLYLVTDLDGDGYYHAIDVVFDADVSYGSATVYAKLYLSREGEPWSQYFTTDLFVINEDDTADAYEVRSELLEGYLPGYYSVLIELYSLDHAYMVASDVLDYQSLGRDVTIEDRARDEPYVEPYVDGGTTYYEEEIYYESSGGGSMAALLLVFLLIQVVIAARGSLALCPRNEVPTTRK